MAEASARSATPEESRDALLALLASAKRRDRQDASHQLVEMSKEHPELLLERVEDIEEALYRPEAQTRWECLDVLATLAEVDPARVVDGFDGAETSLFDEISASVRLSAFRFIARVGASSPELSLRAWPLLDEAVQCFHGDPEYRDMLFALLEFAKGSISEEAKSAVAARVAFDAQKGSGYIKVISRQIFDAAKPDAEPQA
ncbi:MAG: hypothetical protein ACOX4F_03270 [Atopobiaceae bacterium]|jgi:hypothetical protein